MQPETFIENSTIECRSWYAIRAVPRHEKRVRDRLETRDVECFLPLISSEHRWKNGVRATVEVPLFPTYLFVRTTLQDRFEILRTQGVHSFVGIGGTPSVIGDQEVQILQAGFSQAHCTPHPVLTVGDRVKIIAGPFCGLDGIVVREPRGLRVVLTVSVIMQGVSVEVDVDAIAPAPSSAPVPSYA